MIRFLTINTIPIICIYSIQSGAEDVRKHKWFKGLDMQHVLERRLPAPLRPQTTFAGDTRNFEKYPEIDLKEEMRPTGNDPYKSLFKEF